MSYNIELCDDSDIDGVFNVVSRTFQHTAVFVDAMYPDHDTPAGREQGRKRFLETKRNNPSTNFLKAIDAGSGEIVGQAVWTIPALPPKDFQLKGDYWENPDDKQYAQIIFEQLFRARASAMTTSNRTVIVLDWLSVDPSHQKAGIGLRLVRWGTDIADEMGAEAIVEATAAGRPTYEKAGFRSLGQMRFVLPEKHSHRDLPDLHLMIRPARGEDLEIETRAKDVLGSED